MGIIAGVCSKTNQSELTEKLKAMILCQSHRDKDSPVIFTQPQIAIGMANKHDKIFCDDEEKKIKKDLSGNRSGIHAFVDGIVLEVPKHRTFFEGEGIKIAAPKCSSIVEATYEKWGLDFMAHLEGEFSCTIWDKKQGRLILARDPYGHKPVHYYNDNQQFVFSSEIKGVLSADVKREIDIVNLSDYLSLNCIPYPGTIFKDIYQVPPGSILIFEKNEIRIKSYWTPVISDHKSMRFSDAVEILSEKIKTAVQKRMFSGDTYCFLSGGIDSSAIISYASELADKKIHAVTAGFVEEEENELDDAKIMANHVGANHHQVVTRPESFFEMLETLVFHHDSPFSDTSAYPTYYAGKLAGNYTDLILTGDGPDQSMAGSSHHVFAIKNNLFTDRNKYTQLVSLFGSKIAAQIDNKPTPSFFSKIRRKLFRESLTPVHAAYDLRSYFPDIVKKYMCSDDLWQVHEQQKPFRHPDSWFKEVNDADMINQYLYADMKFYVPDDLMIKVDRMCMAHGLETLSPFQDIELAAVVNQLPSNYKIRKDSKNNITTKYILKKCCQNRFPEATLNKKKQGFGIPLEKWLKKNNGKLLKELLFDRRTLDRGLLKNKSIINLVEVFLSNQGDYFYPNPNMIVGLITFELWCRRYID